MYRCLSDDNQRDEGYITDMCTYNEWQIYLRIYVSPVCNPCELRYRYPVLAPDNIWSPFGFLLSLLHSTTENDTTNHYYKSVNLQKFLLFSIIY